MAAIVPTIVASEKLEGQTSTIAPTAIFTAPSAGLFRLSAYLEVEGTAGNGVTTAFSYTDDAGNSGVGVLGGLSSSPGSPVQQTWTFRLAASHAVNYTVSGVDAGVTSFNFYVVIESLD